MQKMKQVLLTITENRKLARGIYLMKLAGDVSAITAPGQFINIKLDGFYLRRPISVCDLSEDSVTIIYKVLGHGTEQMTEYPVGKTLDVLTGLGNGYDLDIIPDGTVLLLGGGVGIPPMYLLAKKLLSEGRDICVCLGYNTKDEAFFVDEFKALAGESKLLEGKSESLGGESGSLGCDIKTPRVEVRIASADGSLGTKGFVTDIIPQEYSYFCTCGPEQMLRAVYAVTTTDGQMSFEERMGCGFGACMGCSCKTITGNKRICKDGPVLRKEDLLW